MINEPLVNINNLTKFFKNSKIPALNGINASIFSGKITGLVGPDGAGKTTFIRLITGLMLPNKGSISVAGYNTFTHAVKIYPIIGYMPQKFGLYENLTVIENLELYAKLRKVPAKDQKDKFKRMLNFTKLSLFQKRLASKLSGGMKQKLGLACALIGDPKLLLLDEPSVGVDLISRRELWHMVKELINNDMGVIWSTSYLDEAEKCDSVILLNKGVKLYDGPPIEILKSVEGRTFQINNIPADKRRYALKQILGKKGIIDGVIQGKYIHIVLDKHVTQSSFSSAFPDYDVSWRPVQPSFEDAFIDILGVPRKSTSSLAINTKEKLKQKKPVIEAHGLTKHFGDFVAVHNISFTLHRGEIFGLLGPNGAGKSTTFKMLCGLLQPTKGNSLVMGFDLKTTASKARNCIGYMAQKFSLYDNLNVLQNLKFFSGLYGLYGKIQKEKIEMMIDIFNFKKSLKKNSSDLPLGLKQRLALACALMHEPDVLFLDEPTSGVDPITRREFWMHINGLVEKGITVMVTTHNMIEAEYCDRIGLVYCGENIATGTPNQLKAMAISKNLPQPTLEDVFIELIKKQGNNLRNRQEVGL